MNEIEKREKFSAWLKAEMSSRGWNVADLAKAAGVPYTSVAALVDGERNVGLQLAKKVAHGLDVDLATVLRAAGQIDPVSQRTEQELQVLRDMGELPPSSVSIIMHLIHTLKEQNKPAAPAK